MLKQGDMIIMGYTIIFNELSCFVPTRVATEEMKMDHFERGLMGDIKPMVVGHNYANF